MAEQVVHTIDSLSGSYRGAIYLLSSGAFRVEVLRWTEEWVPGYGKAGECWDRVSRGLIFADTLERAAQLAREEMEFWEPAALDTVNEPRRIE